MSRQLLKGEPEEEKEEGMVDMIKSAAAAAAAGSSGGTETRHLNGGYYEPKTIYTEFDDDDGRQRNVINSNKNGALRKNSRFPTAAAHKNIIDQSSVDQIQTQQRPEVKRFVRQMFGSNISNRENQERNNPLSQHRAVVESSDVVGVPPLRVVYSAPTLPTPVNGPPPGVPYGDYENYPSDYRRRHPSNKDPRRDDTKKMNDSTQKHGQYLTGGTPIKYEKENFGAGDTGNHQTTAVVICTIFAMVGIISLFGTLLVLYKRRMKKRRRRPIMFSQHAEHGSFSEDDSGNGPQLSPLCVGKPFTEFHQPAVSDYTRSKAGRSASDRGQYLTTPRGFTYSRSKNWPPFDVSSYKKRGKSAKSNHLKSQQQRNGIFSKVPALSYSISGDGSSTSATVNQRILADNGSGGYRPTVEPSIASLGSVEVPGQPPFSVQKTQNDHQERSSSDKQKDLPGVAKSSDSRIICGLSTVLGTWRRSTKRSSMTTQSTKGRSAAAASNTSIGPPISNQLSSTTTGSNANHDATTQIPSPLLSTQTSVTQTNKTMSSMTQTKSLLSSMTQTNKTQTTVASTQLSNPSTNRTRKTGSKNDRQPHLYKPTNHQPVPPANPGKSYGSTGKHNFATNQLLTGSSDVDSSSLTSTVKKDMIVSKMLTKPPNNTKTTLIKLPPPPPSTEKRDVKQQQFFVNMPPASQVVHLSRPHQPLPHDDGDGEYYKLMNNLMMMVGYNNGAAGHAHNKSAGAGAGAGYAALAQAAGDRESIPASVAVPAAKCRPTPIDSSLIATEEESSTLHNRSSNIDNINKDISNNNNHASAVAAASHCSATTTTTAVSKENSSTSAGPPTKNNNNNNMHCQKATVLPPPNLQLAANQSTFNDDNDNNNNGMMTNGKSETLTSLSKNDQKTLSIINEESEVQQTIDNNNNCGVVKDCNSGSSAKSLASGLDSESEWVEPAPSSQEAIILLRQAQPCSLRAMAPVAGGMNNFVPILKPTADPRGAGVVGKPGGCAGNNGGSGVRVPPQARTTNFQQEFVGPQGNQGHQQDNLNRQHQNDHH